MMRWILLAVLVVALSAAATVAVQFLPTSVSEAVPKPIPAKPEGPAPSAVVVGPMKFDFGTMAQFTTSAHPWTVRNEGQGDLKLVIRSTTCKCTVANLGDKGESIVKPGGQTEIRLEWSTKEVNGPFKQSATIATNDPEHPELVLEVTGTVQPPILIYPPDPAPYLASIANDKGAQVDRAIYSPDRPDLKITAIRSSRPELIEATVTPLDAERLKQLDAKGGLHLEVRVKPSTALGPFSEELVLVTDHPAQPEVRLMISGRLLGPINIEPSEVRMNVPGVRGDRKDVYLLVRGRSETRFEVEKAPAPLKVAIVPADEQARGNAGAPLRRYKLTITVPPGSDPGELDGSILLKTDHPQAGRVTIPVKVVISG